MDNKSARDKSKNARRDRASTELITLTCPSCGGKLTTANNTRQIVCEYCGTEVVVKSTAEESRSEASTPPNRDRSVEIDLAIARLREEIAGLKQEKRTLETQRNSGGFMLAVGLLMVFGAVGFGALLESLGLTNGLERCFLIPVIVMGFVSIGIGGYNMQEKKNDFLEEKMIEKQQELSAYERLVASEKRLTKM